LPPHHTLYTLSLHDALPIYVSTLPAAEQTSSARPITNRQRVSSHDFVQSISLLRADRLEKNLFERDGNDFHRHRIQRPRFAHNPDRKSTRLNSSHVAISYAV